MEVHQEANEFSANEKVAYYDKLITQVESNQLIHFNESIELKMQRKH